MGWAQRQPRQDVECAVYRLLATDGRLLYVGMAEDPFRRLEQHVKQKEWWAKVDHSDIEWFACRQDAADAELRAIRLELPVYNVQGTGGRHQCRATPEHVTPVRARESFWRNAEVRI